MNPAAGGCRQQMMSRRRPGKASPGARAGNNVAEVYDVDSRDIDEIMLSAEMMAEHFVKFEMLMMGERLCQHRRRTRT
jgi:hypothetical protein